MKSKAILLLLTVWAICLISQSKDVKAEGNAEHGASLYSSRCIGCHSVEENRVGPMHRGVFGRVAGKVKGYDYSAAVKSSDIIWDEYSLNLWLSNPEALIPGQKMGYRVESVVDRADLIAFLKTLKN